MSCKIIFDKTNYVAGDNVGGCVEITSSHPITIRYISLTIKGSADVHWTESESYEENGERKSRTITYSSHEQYLNSRTILYGQEGGPTIHLPAGSHSYNFLCALPHGLPGTIAGKYGTIKYIANVKFDIPWAFDDKFENEFHVLPRVELSQDPSLKMPSQVEKIKNYCTWKCSTSPATITATLPQSGFIRNEDIPISVHITNMSHVDIIGIQTKLVKSVVFRSTSPRSKEKNETGKIAHYKFDLGDKRNDRVIDMDTKLTVPYTPITCNIASNIKVSYHVEVAIYVSGCHNTARLYIPVTIGTFPVHANWDTTTNLSQMPLHATAASVTPSPVHHVNTLMPVMPPPLPMSSPGHVPAPMPNTPNMPVPMPVPTAPTPDGNLKTPPPPSYSEVVYGWKNDEKPSNNSPSAPGF